MQVSIILTTYNQPRLLEKVLWGYAAQTARDFELLIADDGSDEETASCIERLRRLTRMTIHHVWHEHVGFRKTVILNRAIEAAAADYLLFSDGDCVPRRDFVAQHLRHAERGCLLSGGCLRLSQALSEQIDRDDILSGRALELRWLLSKGMRWSHELLKLCHPNIGRYLDAITTTHATWNGHNSSGWLADIVRANGFDERMVYGGLDRELGERLMNAGIRPKQIRHRAICAHLWHERGYVDLRAWQYNHQIRREVRQHGFTWTPYGIKKSRDLLHVIGDGPASSGQTTPASRSRMAA